MQRLGMIPLGFRAGARLLTIFPLRYDSLEEHHAPARTLAWFPVIGLAIGAPVYLVMLAPLPALPRAALALGLWVILTGGLHEDGLLDCADAAFATATRERRLQILRDPHVGAHAVTAGVLLMLLRFSALTTVPAAAVLAAPVIGRWFMAVSLSRATPARAGGLGAHFAEGANARWPTAVMVLLAVLLSTVAGADRTAAAVILAVLFGGGSALFLSRRFGGLNGDGHGAAGLVAELGALLAFVPVTMLQAP